MTEKEFIKFYKEKMGLKNFQEAKIKVTEFWEVVSEALEIHSSVSFRNWGVFEKKVIPSRRILNIHTKQHQYSLPSTIVKFRASSVFSNKVAFEE